MIKKLTTLIALLSSMTFAANAHAWTKEDTMWELAYLATHIADWGQTLDIASQCGNGAYYETNPILGTCPSAQTVNAYFVGTALLHAATAQLMPRKYRRMFQTTTMAMQIGFVTNNAQIGLNLKF